MKMLVIFTATLLFTAVAWAQQTPVTLAARWQPGLRYVYRSASSIEGKQFIPAAKQTIVTSHERSGEAETVVSPGEAPGELNLSTRNLFVTIRTNTSGMKMTFDSRKPGSGPLATMGKMEAGLTYVHLLDASGAVQKILVEHPNPTPPAPKVVESPWVEDVPWIGSMPSGTRAVGEQWTAKQVARFNGGRCGEVESNQRFTFAKMETVEGRECAVIEITATLTDREGRPATPAMDGSFLEKGSVTATVWIEPATATVVRQEAKADLRIHYAAGGASGWRMDSVETSERTLVSMTPAEARPLLAQAAPASSPAGTKAGSGAKPAPGGAALPEWARSDDPKVFTLGFYKWYYGKIREVKGEWPIVSQRADIRRVLAASVSPKIVQAAAQFVESDGEKGAIPFAPGNDGDDFWGDHATVTKVSQEGKRTRVAVFLKGTSKGYEKFDATDTVLLEKGATGWLIVSNDSATESAAPAPAVAGVKFVSPSGKYGVVVTGDETRGEKASLVALPGKKVLQTLVEGPEFWNLEIDLQWNPASTQFAFFSSMRRTGEVSVFAVAGTKVAPRELPAIELPVHKEYGSRIEREGYQATKIKRWIDGETLLLTSQGRLMIVEKKGRAPYWIDYEYEVTVALPAPGKPQVQQVKKVKVGRVTE